MESQYRNQNQAVESYYKAFSDNLSRASLSSSRRLPMGAPENNSEIYISNLPPRPSSRTNKRNDSSETISLASSAYCCNCINNQLCNHKAQTKAYQKNYDAIIQGELNEAGFMDNNSGLQRDYERKLYQRQLGDEYLREMANKNKAKKLFKDQPLEATPFPFSYTTREEEKEKKRIQANLLDEQIRSKKPSKVTVYGGNSLNFDNDSRRKILNCKKERTIQAQNLNEINRKSVSRARERWQQQNDEREGLFEAQKANLHDELANRASRKSIQRLQREALDSQIQERTSARERKRSSTTTHLQNSSFNHRLSENEKYNEVMQKREYKLALDRQVSEKKRHGRELPSQDHSNFSRMGERKERKGRCTGCTRKVSVSQLAKRPAFKI